LSNGKKEFLCNGALIDQKKILTVAQCVEAFENYPEQIDVRLGEYDLEQEVEPDAFEDHQVSSIRIHPKYDNDTLTNDLAILTLVDYVKNAVHISPVCLPSESEAFESKSCVTTGWGNRQSVLKEFFVDCLGDEECSQRLHRSKLGPYYHLHPSFFCAQSRDQSSCLIDGGGPLVCRRRDSSYALIGLLSWSVDDNSPDMYVRVQQFLNWIQNDAVTTTTQTVRTTRSVEVTSVTEEVHQEEHSSSSTQTSQEVHPSEESQNNNNGVIVPSPAPIPPTADVDENSTGQQEQTEDADKRKKHPFPAEVHDYETK
jgi:secreted trypsin-like serine protease